MRLVLGVAAAVLVAAPVSATASPDPSPGPSVDDGSASARVVFRIDDERIDESSGLVDLGELMVTANDSGDEARLFVLDARTGETVGVTTYADEVDDVEALAPARARDEGPGRVDAVWVGDIGDNRASRDEITVHRVPVGRGERVVQDAPSHELRYPDGAHDAEAMVADADDRLWIITKSLTGGAVYRAPLPLRSGVNTLQRVGQVRDYATDAALLLDDRRLLVRGYAGATLYRFPSLQPLGSFRLPSQPQGEAVSVGPTPDGAGRVRISSEGVGEPVYEVRLPPRPTPRAEPTLPASREPDPTPQASPQAPDERGTWLAWVVSGILLAAAAGVTVAVGRRSR